jgi:CelD/BcsL family acetyltransferase involved in cellulose biosynthesis
MVDLDERLPVAGARAPRPLRTPAASARRFAVVEPAALTRLLPEWAALANRSAADNPFFHPDFAVPAIAHLNRHVAIAAVGGGDGQLAAVAPFTRARLGRIAPAARLWSHKYGPLGTPLIGDGDVAGAVAALIEGLAPAASGTSLVVPDLPLDEPVATALIATALQQNRPVNVVGRHLRAVLDRPPGGAVDLRAALPVRRRKEVGRQLRRLADLGTVTIESETDPEGILPALEDFLALENAGWKGRAGTALIASRATAAFVRSAVASRAASGAARIDALALDGRPIAMLVSFIAGATAFTWKIAYDETCARFSPGAQLMLEAAPRIFAETSVTRIDSCADADHPMIDRLWPGRMVVGTLIVGPPGGSLVHSAGLTLAKAEAMARAGLHRLRR